MNTHSSQQAWPPDRGTFRRDPTAQQQEPLTTFEKIIRYAEKDDMLLYATAIFGLVALIERNLFGKCFRIVMPAVMYFVYKSAHAKYQVYAKVSSRKSTSFLVNRRFQSFKQPVNSLLICGFSGNVKRSAKNVPDKELSPFST